MENTLKKPKNTIIYDREDETYLTVNESEILDKATGPYPHELWDVADVYEETLDESIS